MTSIPVTQARSKLYELLDEAADSHEPIQIMGKRSNEILVSEDDWLGMTLRQWRKLFRDGSIRSLLSHD